MTRREGRRQSAWSVRASAPPDETWTASGPAPRALSGDHRAQIVGALRSPLELKTALRLVAGIVLERTGADHVSVFLLEGGCLLPAVALGKKPSPEAWQAMKALGPIHLNKSRIRAFMSGDPVVVDDVRLDGLVPEHIVETFALRSMAMVAMGADKTICGVLAVGRDDVRPFSDEEVGALSSLATYAARAVTEARPFESVRRRARLQEALARGSAALATPLEDEEIATRLVEAFSELLDTGTCAVALVDDDQVRMTRLVATQPIEARTPIPFSEIPPGLVRQVGRAWLCSGGPGPVEIDDEPWAEEVLGAGGTGVSRYVLVPLVVYERIRGAVVLGFRGRIDLDPEEGAAVDALAAMGAAALERYVLLQRLAAQVRQLETLHAHGADLAHRADPPVLLARVNAALKELGAEVVGVTMRDGELARHLGADTASTPEPAAWGDGRWAELCEQTWSVPVRLGGHVAGALRVRAGELDAPQRMFVEALGNGLAEVASRAVLREALEAEARERVLEEDRMRMARDLHDTVGQTLVAMDLLAGALADSLVSGSSEEAQAARLSELAAEGKASIDDAVRALAFVPTGDRDLGASLEALASTVEEDSGIAVSVTITGDLLLLPVPVEQALYRVAHGALANAWRHARCRRIEVELFVGSSEVSLRVADDGVGIEPRSPGDRRGTGLPSMKGAMEEVSGTLEVHHRQPTGLVVEARVGSGAW
jgi:signal transduction histidine kinase